MKLFKGLMYRLTMTVLVLVMLASLYKVWNHYATYREGRAQYDSIRILAENLVETPVVKEGKVYRQINFEALWSVNPDVVGWIERTGTKIDYPIVQAKDNRFYLNRLLDGSYSSFGSIYMDFRSDKDFSGRNTVIYGHHMNDGSMFGGLKNWKDQAYYEKHPVIMLYTPEKNYEIQLFAGYTTTAVEGMRNDFADDEDFEAYINKLKRLSTFQSNVTMTANDRIIALYTCAYDFRDARYVLYGKLVELD